MSHTTEIKLKELNLRALELSKDTRLYVLNKCRPRGEILMSVTRPNGREQTVTVPATWIPVDLTLQSRFQEILDSPDFRRAVARGFVVPVDADEAEKFCAENQLAITELDRILNRADGSSTFAQNVGSGSGKPVVSERMEEIRSQVGSTAVKDESGQGVSGSVMQTVARSNSDNEGSISDREALSMLMGMSLNNAELDYIVKNSQQSTIKDWAASKL